MDADCANDALDHAMASYRRDLGPGVQHHLHFMWADYGGEATGSADDNDGIGPPRVLTPVGDTGFDRPQAPPVLPDANQKSPGEAH